MNSLNFDVNQNLVSSTLKKKTTEEKSIFLLRLQSRLFLNQFGTIAFFRVISAQRKKNGRREKRKNMLWQKDGRLSQLLKKYCLRKCEYY